MCIGIVSKRHLGKRRDKKKKVRKKRKKPGKKKGEVNKVMELGPAGALVLLCCGVREG